MSDVSVGCVFLLAAVTVFGPGAVLLWTLGTRQGVVLLGAAAPASVGVAMLVASGCAVAGLSYGPLALLVGTVALCCGGAGLKWGVVRRFGPPGVLPRLATTALLPPLAGVIGWVARLVGVVFVLLGAGLAVHAWVGGIGELSTWNQDHDTILHAVLTAYVQYSGRGAPWQIAPADLIANGPVSFYPDGFHLMASVIGAMAGDPVVGMNVAAATIIGAGWTSSAGALAAVAVRWLRDDPGWAWLAAGVGAVIASGLYRPGVAMARDNGLLPNASAMVLAAGVVAAILSVRPKAWASACGVAVACAGIVTVHPTATVSVGLTVVMIWAALLCTSDGAALLRAQFSAIVVLVCASAVLSVPVALGALQVVGRVAAFPPDSGVGISPGKSLGVVVALVYGGGFDDQELVQVWPSILVVAGLLTSLVLRRSVPLTVAWLAWVVIVLLAFRNPEGLTAPVMGFFYNSAQRVRGHVGILAPALAALGVFGLLRVLMTAVVSARMLRLCTRQAHACAPEARPRLARIGPVISSPAARLGNRPSPGWLTPSSLAVTAVTVIVLFGCGYMAGPNSRYLISTSRAVAERWSAPQFYRVDENDINAAAWLRGRVAAGERIMNNPNDGSTYLYVRHHLPIVELSTLGLFDVPYTYRLLQRFSNLRTDPEVRRLVLQMNIAWLYVDSRVPRIVTPGSPQNWTAGKPIATLPGWDHLNDVPGLHLVHTSGPVRIYHIDLDEIRLLDRTI